MILWYLSLIHIFQVLGASDAELAAKLDAARAEAVAKVLEKNKAVEAKYNH